MISARNASLALGSGDARVDILRGLDLDVARGARVALLGASGSGKSSLMALLTGLERASAGTITVAGEDFTKLDAQIKAIGTKPAATEGKKTS